MILKDLKRYIESELCNLYNPYESESIAYLIIQHVFSYDKTKIILNYRNQVNEKSLVVVDEILQKLKTHEPIQYIFGETEFYELKFKVNKDTLIPRQETELLVYNIINFNKNNRGLKILDIGTGSGCIAISLSKNMENTSVVAMDISNKALVIAEENSNINKVEVSFVKADILNLNEEIKESFDIIVSNPPYVTDKEKKDMQKNVLNFEPHNALFVSDENPLVFYEKIILESKNRLKLNGQLWFEINEKFGNEVAQLMIEQGFKAVGIIKDFNKKERIVFGILK